MCQGLHAWLLCGPTLRCLPVSGWCLAPALLPLGSSALLAPLSWSLSTDSCCPPSLPEGRQVGIRCSYPSVSGVGKLSLPGDVPKVTQKEQPLPQPCLGTWCLLVWGPQCSCLSWIRAAGLRKATVHASAFWLLVVAPAWAQWLAAGPPGSWCATSGSVDPRPVRANIELMGNPVYEGA